MVHFALLTVALGFGAGHYYGAVAGLMTVLLLDRAIPAGRWSGPLVAWLLGALAGLIATWTVPAWWHLSFPGNGYLAWLSMAALAGLPLAVAASLRAQPVLGWGLALSLDLVLPLPGLIPLAFAGTPNALWLVSFGGLPLLGIALGATRAVPRLMFVGIAVAAFWETTPKDPVRVQAFQFGPETTVDRARDTMSSDADLVVLPEAAWPESLGARQPAGHTVGKLLAWSEGLPPVVLGARSKDEPPNYLALAVHDGVLLGESAKASRLPIIEREWMGFGADRVAEGTARSLPILGRNLGAAICYEGVVPHSGIHGAPALVLAKEDLIGPQMARLALAATSIQAARWSTWVVRSSVSGAAAVLDPVGTVHVSTPWIPGGEQFASLVAEVGAKSPLWRGGAVGRWAAFGLLVGLLYWLRYRPDLSRSTPPQ